MKKVVLVLAVMAFPSSAMALQGPYTPSLTCAQAQQMIYSRGAAVLNTGTYTYDRYVRDGRFCLINEYLERAWVPTRDTPQCPIGYRCVTDPPFFWDD